MDDLDQDVERYEVSVDGAVAALLVDSSDDWFRMLMRRSSPDEISATIGSIMDIRLKLIRLVDIARQERDAK